MAQNVAYTTLRAFNDINAAHLLRGAYDMAVFGISQFLDGISVIWIKNGRYSVFQLPNGDGEIQFLIENTTMMVKIGLRYYGSFQINQR